MVSHSNIKTKSIAFPNVQRKRIFSQTLNRMVRLYMSTSAIRSMEHMGGFDVYILNQSDEVLSPRALVVKNQILRKISARKSELKEANARAVSGKKATSLKEEQV